MKKLSLIILAIIIFALASGCRGIRTVKVYINAESWTCTLKVGSDTSYPSGNTSKTIKLGDSVTSVTADVTRIDPADAGTLTVQIIEEYEPGFLYLASSEVMDEDSTTVPGATVSVKYTFSESK